MNAAPPLPLLLSVGALAARASVHRAVVLKLHAQGIIAPAAMLAFGEVPQPLYPAEVLPVILQHQQPTNPRARAS